MATTLAAGQPKHRSVPTTIPASVEEVLGLEEGERLLYVEEDGRVFLQREARRSLGDVIGSIEVNRPLLTDDEVDAGLAKAMEPEVRAEYERILGSRMTLDEIIANPLTISGPHSDDFDEEIEEAMEIETRRYLERDRYKVP